MIRDFSQLYPICVCGKQMKPVWFTEEERDERNILTGRKRRACSHFECSDCFKKECVDDTFDGKWR